VSVSSKKEGYPTVSCFVEPPPPWVGEAASQFVPKKRAAKEENDSPEKVVRLQPLPLGEAAMRLSIQSLRSFGD
jgi:hypothetical protein